MDQTCRLRITRDDYQRLIGHLFPGDDEEHGAVLLAGSVIDQQQITLTVREVHLAKEGTDYVESTIGHRALSPTFIHRLITRARDEQLVYLAAHNHLSDRQVSFSHIDMASHDRGYPALLQITRGIPVGALVLGRRSMQADVWISKDSRISLEHATVVGNTIQRIKPFPSERFTGAPNAYERQVRMFGAKGQAELTNCRVGIIGLGGIGSLVTEYLARMGIGSFVLIDNDFVEESNLSRIAGSVFPDILTRTSKVEVASRLIHQANREANINTITDDVARESVAKVLKGCDYIFLAADSMRARLVFNALVHQYLIPGVQLGSKIRCDSDGNLLEVMNANRPVRPGHGCLWCNQLIDPTGLAKEAKSDDDRKSQAYGTEEPNPSVIALNAIAASHGVNDFLLNYLCLRSDKGLLHYEHLHWLRDTRILAKPRKDSNCTECSTGGNRFGRADSYPLPCIES